MQLHSARDIDGAMDLLRSLGYDTDQSKPYDLSDVGLQGTAVRLRQSQSKGYGVLLAEIEELPRSMKSVGSKLIDNFHDHPLALFGIRDGNRWTRLVIVRPRLIKGGGGAITISRLVMDPRATTAHDASVCSGLEWKSTRSDGANQQAIDEALDVERVTKKFFQGLTTHYRLLVLELEALCEADVGLNSGVHRAGGTERVGLRIVTQTLFCYFLQKKGLLEGNPSWLSDEFKRCVIVRDGHFYSEVMEPLFYEALNRPKDERNDHWHEKSVPFLNGGLFERSYGDVTPSFSNEVFSADEGLLGFLDGWSFTVAEERADETEVAVDPEMLGKVFENLMSPDRRKREGTVYTPRPVVQFMCREALIPFLQRQVEIEENEARALIDGDDPFAELADLSGIARASQVAPLVEKAMTSIRVIDPAVGSGAFPLGMLSEIVRLREHAHVAGGNQVPGESTIYEWKLHAIENSLFGVDINPAAIELCRLRLWLSLVVDMADGDEPKPLPNLEYRTIAANSLSDFVAGVEVQNSRDPHALDVSVLDTERLIELRHKFFSTSVPGDKMRLRNEITEAENELLTSIFEMADTHNRDLASRESSKIRKVANEADEALVDLRESFAGPDRVFPVFMPSFHAPEATADGGWDVVIMNPPYLGRKEIKQVLKPTQISDLERHFGKTSDLMILFARRAMELVCDGGGMSMIFNDSIFTSTDAETLRRDLLTAGGRDTVHVAARTKCFEGVVVNGGVIVATREHGPDPEIRWVENHGRPVTDLLAAGRIADTTRRITPVGQSELFEVNADLYHRLPHRPLFRPSKEAEQVLKVYRRCAAWDQFSRMEAESGGSWGMLSNTSALNRWIEARRVDGFYDKFVPGKDFVLLGLVIEGGQGLATAEDRRFLAAIEGSEDYEKALVKRAELAELTSQHPEGGPLLRDLLGQGIDAEEALLSVSLTIRPERLGWSKSGLIRTISLDQVRNTELTATEVERGIVDGATFIPFEKGDNSAESGGGAAWWRNNPLAIDWSASSVALLRARAAGEDSYRKPRFQNESLWGKPGVTWNAIGRYLRAREVTGAGIFGHNTPTISPKVPWLTKFSLLALLNSPTADFISRTFLGQQARFEVGDIRRIPIPVLSEGDGEALSELGRRGVETARLGGDTSELNFEVDQLTRRLYGLDDTSSLWVAR